jgi:hypothetical protein
VFPRVTHGFQSTNSSCGLRNHQRSANRSCGLINHQWKPSLSYIRNHKQNWFHGWCMDLTAQTAPMGSRNVKENWDAIESEIVTETVWTADAWSRQHKQLLWAQKSSTKLNPWLTHGFDSANSSCGLKKRQRKLRRYRVRNYHRNFLHSWRLEYTAQTAPVGSEIIIENWDVVVSEIITETDSTADSWSRQRKQL